MSTTQISTVSGITLVTLQGSPATTAFMADVFERIAKLNVNNDMISMPPNHGANAGLSFTWRPAYSARSHPATRTSA